MDILSQRLEKKEDSICEAVLEVDEGAEVLEQDDRKLITETQHKVKEELKHSASFAAEYTARRKEVNIFLLEQASKGPKAKRGKTSAPALPSVISQATAKQFLPGDGRCTIWKGHARLDWNGHCPPFRRVHAANSLYGEEGAMLRVISMLWRQWCKKQACEFSASSCPFYDKLNDHATDVDVEEG